jgi:Flp pilus assembly protein TadD
LAIFERVLGSDHPNVATLVNNLGMVLQYLGDLAGARAAYERALRIFEEFLPPEHPSIRTVRGNLEGLDRAGRGQE